MIRQIFPSELDIQYTNKIAEELFKTEGDETQEKPTLKTAQKLIAIEKNNFICLKDEDKIIAWSVVLPISTESYALFIKGNISEKELFDTHLERPSFEALYLTAVVVLPEYRNKGIGSSLMKTQIEYFIAKYKVNLFCALTLSAEGKKLIETIERDLSIRVPTMSRI